MSISQSVSGYGTSGVVTATMTFVTSSFYSDIGQNSTVKLKCTNASIESPDFYVTGRKNSGGITEWTCCDVVSKTDRLINFSDSDFDENDKITVSDVLDIIHAQCGIGVNASGLSALLHKTLDKTQCEDGLTVRRVLELLSEAMCGYWLGVGGQIVFVNFGQTVFSAVPTSYKAIDFNGSVDYARVLCTDDDAVYSANASGSGKTLIVSTDFASQELADSILDSMVGGNNNYTYRSWSCGKGKTDEWLYTGAYHFGDKLLICNSVSMSVSASGLFFTASANSIDEDEVGYTSEVNRQLKRKLEFDKINGNMAVTGKGLYFFENGYKKMTAEEQKDAKYSFNVEKGITEYSGAMVSKVVPKSVKWSNSKTEAVIDYGEKKYKYLIVKDDDGNISRFEKAEVKEEKT